MNACHSTIMVNSPSCNPNLSYEGVDAELVEVQALVMWLEDKKIRAWEVEERKGLRNFDSKEWFNEFHRVS